MTGDACRLDRRRTTLRGAATRDRIVATAARLVAARGAAGTSLDDIKAASRVSKSQLYHYFADKDALMCAVAAAQADQVIASQQSCLEAVSTLEGLKRWRDTVLGARSAAGEAGGCPLGSLASELAERSEPAREILANAFGRWQRNLAASLGRMRAQGELRADAEPDDLAMAIVAALQGGLLLAQTTRSTRPLQVALGMALDHVAHYATKA